MNIISLRMAWMYCIIGKRGHQVWLHYGCWNWWFFYLLKSSNFSETLANESDRNTLKTLQEFNWSVGLPLILETFEQSFGNSVGKSPFSLEQFQQIFAKRKRKRTRLSSDFANQMYNLVKLLAHPAGFEPTACRLGDENRAFLLYPSNARKRLLLLHF